MTPFFSIIIPVYNVAPYLRECLDSVLSQSFADWEAICIDDGSTDGSGEILDEYATRDARFRIVHKRNEGVSVARHTGLAAACGKYVAWVDADDWVDTCNLEAFYKVLRRGGCDFAWCDCYEDTDAKSTYSKQEAPLEPAKYMQKLLGGVVWGSLWNKVISREFISKHNIGFPDQGCKMMEDVCFVIGVIANSPRMAYFPEAHYHYIKHDGTLTRQSGNHEEKYRRWIGGEEYVQRSITVFGDAFEEMMLRRKKCLLQAIYSDRNVSDKLFYETFKDVHELSGINSPIWHRCLFRLARRGYRKSVLKILNVLHALKATAIH